MITTTHVDEAVLAPFAFFDKPTGAGGQQVGHLKREQVEGILHAMGVCCLLALLLLMTSLLNSLRLYFGKGKEDFFHSIECCIECCIFQLKTYFLGRGKCGLKLFEGVSLSLNHPRDFVPA